MLFVLLVNRDRSVIYIYRPVGRSVVGRLQLEDLQPKSLKSTGRPHLTSFSSPSIRGVISLVEIHHDATTLRAVSNLVNKM
jgi:hypothetical protein